MISYINHVSKKWIVQLLCISGIIFLFDGIACGQSIVYMHPAVNSEESIIRNHKENIDIRMEWFSYSYPGCQVFHYVNRATGSTVCFPLSVDYGISDFEILDGYVYFCGSYGGTRALVGYFNIDSAFFLNGLVHLMIVNSPVNAISTIDHIHNFLNLDVYKVDNLTHMVMTGVGYFSSNRSKSTAYPSSFVAEAWQTSTSTWDFQYVMDYTQTLNFHDIAAVNKQVVVVGHKNHSPYSSLSPEYFTTRYKKPSTLMGSQSMFNTTGGSGPFFTNSIYTTDTLVFAPGQRIRIIRMTDDGFATACGADIDNGNLVSVISVYSNPATAATTRFAFHDQSYSISNIRYNHISKSIAGLTCHNFVYRFTEPYHDVEKVIVTGVNINNCCSLDSVRGKPFFTISGALQDCSVAKQWLFDVYNPGGCMNVTVLPTQVLSTSQVESSITQEISNALYTIVAIPVKSQTSTLLKECY